MSTSTLSWTYKVMEVGQFEHEYEATQMLNREGCVGWELVCVWNGFFIFKSLHPYYSTKEVDKYPKGGI